MKQHLFGLLLVFILSACVVKSNNEYVIVEKIVIDKTKIHDEFYVAFSDGDDITTTYGFYTILNVGDTVVWEARKGYTSNLNFWYSTVLEVKHVKKEK